MDWTYIQSHAFPMMNTVLLVVLTILTILYPKQVADAAKITEEIVAAAIKAGAEAHSAGVTVGLSATPTVVLTPEIKEVEK